MNNALASPDPEDRPETVPEAVWPELKKTIVLLRTGVERRSVAQIAESFGLTFGQLNSILHSNRWKVQLEEAREMCVQSSAIALGSLHGLLHEKLRDPEKTSKLSIPDTAKTIKALGDHKLNMANGTAGGIFNNNQYTWADVKILMERRAKPPVKAG